MPAASGAKNITIVDVTDLNVTVNHGIISVCVYILNQLHSVVLLSRVWLTQAEKEPVQTAELCS